MGIDPEHLRALLEERCGACGGARDRRVSGERVACHACHGRGARLTALGRELVAFCKRWLADDAMAERSR